MIRYRIQGGVPLRGEVPLHGAKNAALPILGAALLTDRPCSIRGVPRLRDVDVMLQILVSLGVEHRIGEEGEHLLQAGSLVGHEVSEGLMRRMRSSIMLMGPLLARQGRARLSYPGGCAIGSRPIDLHLRALRALGAEIEERGGFIEARADRLRGAAIDFDLPSVGATENALMAAVLAQGESRLGNVAREPEIVDLVRFLRRMGARIEGEGTDTIRVEGVPALGGADHVVIPDRIEAGTYLAAAAITGGEVRLTNVRPEHLGSPIEKLRQAGMQIEVDGDGIAARMPGRPLPIDFRTQVYPGFPTDLQSPFLALTTVADGTSVITETIFENRFKMVAELCRMGARVSVDGRVAVVRGVPRLTGAAVECNDDLRGGAALVLAALAAEGESEVAGVEHIERGYQDLDLHLRALGARIEKVEGGR